MLRNRTRNYFIRSKILGVGQVRRMKQLPGHKVEKLLLRY